MSSEKSFTPEEILGVGQKRFLSIDDLANLPPPVWMVEGVFERGSLVMLAGPPASLKSFMLIDWLLCMASGRKWLNRKTQTCKVAYVLGEGKSSLFKRITAWIKYNELSEDELRRLKENFKVTFEVPQFASKASTDNLLASLVQEDFKPEVIAVDTFARSFVGLDENDAKDTGVWIDSADRLRQLGYTVLFLHHTKKNTEFGMQYRGSSAVLGAMDTSMTLERKDNSCTLRITKQKDHDEGKPMRFNKINVGMGNEGSCVLVPAMAGISINMDDEEGGELTNTIMASDEVNNLASRLVADETFLNDTERAEVLANESGLTLNAARTRVSRIKVKKSKV